MMSSASKPGSASTVMPSAAEHFLGDVDLAAELVGRRRPVGLVLGIPLGAEGLPRHVERRGDVGGLLVAQQVDQHGGEAVDRVGGQPALGLEVLRGQRVERPERQRIAVQQHQCGLCRVALAVTASLYAPPPTLSTPRSLRNRCPTAIDWPIRSAPSRRAPPWCRPRSPPALPLAGRSCPAHR